MNDSMMSANIFSVKLSFCEKVLIYKHIYDLSHLIFAN